MMASSIIMISLVLVWKSCGVRVSKFTEREKVSMRTELLAVMVLTQVSHGIDEVVDAEALNLVIFKQVTKRGIIGASYHLPMLA